MQYVPIPLSRRIHQWSGDTKALHVLVPSGIGDVAWVLCKFLPIAQRRSVVFHLPEGEDKATNEYLDMLGLQYEYTPGLATPWVWQHPGSPPIPKRGGCVVVQANSHLEAGRRIERWYPQLPVVWPTANVRTTPVHPFVLMFPASRGYMGGNLTVLQWLEIGRELSKIAPVRVVGRGDDVEFAGAIAKSLGGDGHMMDRPLQELLAAASSVACKLFVGCAAGPLIAATYMGARTLLAYPDHLEQMPGSWEQPGAETTACMLRDLPGQIKALVLDPVAKVV